jgi:tetratricopeptide (TPR) repeat protein
LRKDPNNLAALVDLVAALEGQGRMDEAVQTVQRALAIDPNYVRLHLLYAGLEARRNRPEEALALVDAAIRLDPRFPEARIRKAYLLEELGRADDAKDVLQQALREDEQDPPANAAYAQLVELRGGDLAAAERRLHKALARDPFLAPAWQLLGVTLARAGRTDEAIDAYREALRRVPDSEDAHAQLGVLLARQRAGAEAESHLREAIRLSPGFRADAHVALGAWLAEHGRLEDAQQEYAKVLEKEPNNAGARNNRAIALQLSGRAAEAERELDVLLREQPGNADAHNNLAVIALGRKDWKRAEKERARRSSRTPRWCRRSNLGIALDEQGNSRTPRRHCVGRYRSIRLIGRRATTWRPRCARPAVPGKQRTFSRKCSSRPRAIPTFTSSSAICTSVRSRTPSERGLTTTPSCATHRSIRVPPRSASGWREARQHGNRSSRARRDGG